METGKYCRDYVLDKIESVGFKDDTLLPHPKNYNKYFFDFIISKQIDNNATFDVSLVVGTDHPRYMNKTWIACLQNLRRECTFSGLRCDNVRPSILYYTCKTYRRESLYDPWSIDVVNDRAFITQGNHRTIIARFLSELDLIQREQFGLKYVCYMTFDIKAHKQFLRIENFVRMLPFGIQEDIDFTLSNRVVKQDEAIKEYQIIYKLFTGETYEEFDRLSAFRRALFEQIKVFKRYRRVEYLYYIFVAHCLSFSRKISKYFTLFK